MMLTIWLSEIKMMKNPLGLGAKINSAEIQRTMKPKCGVIMYPYMEGLK